MEELVAYGDLTEVEKTPSPAASRGRLLYVTPPSFVLVPSGRILLLGITPESVEWLPRELVEKVEYQGHVRALPANSCSTRIVIAQGSRIFRATAQSMASRPQERRADAGSGPLSRATYASWSLPRANLAPFVTLNRPHVATDFSIEEARRRTLSQHGTCRGSRDGTPYLRCRSGRRYSSLTSSGTLTYRSNRTHWERLR